MIRTSRLTAAATAALFCLLALWSAGTRLAAAEPGTEEKPAAPAASAAAPDQSSPAAAAPADSGESKAPSLSPAENEDMKRLQSEFWQLRIDMDVPSLAPQAVLYAIFDKDPVAAFTAHVKKTESYRRQQLEKADNDARREQLRDIDMSGSWDIGFKEVSGDRVGLLTKRPGARSGGTSSSNTPAGKRWIVTKTVQIDGKPVCWCIPVEVKRGELTTVTLSENNQFDLRVPTTVPQASRLPMAAKNQRPKGRRPPRPGRRQPCRRSQKPWKEPWPSLCPSSPRATPKAMNSTGK